jgi:hypothetical protein
MPPLPSYSPFPHPLPVTNAVFRGRRTEYAAEPGVWHGVILSGPTDSTIHIAILRRHVCRYLCFSTIEGVTPADLFGISCGLTACALFALGAYSSKYVTAWYARGLASRLCSVYYVSVLVCPLTSSTHAQIFQIPMVPSGCFRHDQRCYCGSNRISRGVGRVLGRQSRWLRRVVTRTADLGAACEAADDGCNQQARTSRVSDNNLWMFSCATIRFDPRIHFKCRDGSVEP